MRVQIQPSWIQEGTFVGAGAEVTTIYGAGHVEGHVIDEGAVAHAVRLKASRDLVHVRQFALAA